MKRLTIKETCSCEASIEIGVDNDSSYHREWAAKVVEAWRAEHRHAETLEPLVGIVTPDEAE